MRRTIETPGGPLSYELTRKAVKNLNFRLLPGGELAVSAPRRVLPEQVDALVRQKTDWVERARRRQETRRTAADGQGVWLLGERLRLTAVPGERDGFAAGDGMLILTLRPGRRPGGEAARSWSRPFWSRRGGRCFPRRFAGCTGWWSRWGFPFQR